MRCSFFQANTKVSSSNSLLSVLEFSSIHPGDITTINPLLNTSEGSILLMVATTPSGPFTNMCQNIYTLVDPGSDWVLCIFFILYLVHSQSHPNFSPGLALWRDSRFSQCLTFPLYAMRNVYILVLNTNTM